MALAAPARGRLDGHPAGRGAGRSPPTSPSPATNLGPSERSAASRSSSPTSSGSPSLGSPVAEQRRRRGRPASTGSGCSCTPRTAADRCETGESVTFTVTALATPPGAYAFDNHVHVSQDCDGNNLDGTSLPLTVLPAPTPDPVTDANADADADAQLPPQRLTPTPTPPPAPRPAPRPTPTPTPPADAHPGEHGLRRGASAPPPVPSPERIGRCPGHPGRAARRRGRVARRTTLAWASTCWGCLTARSSGSCPAPSSEARPAGDRSSWGSRRWVPWPGSRPCAAWATTTMIAAPRVGDSPGQLAAGTPIRTGSRARRPCWAHRPAGHRSRAELA